MDTPPIQSTTNLPPEIIEMIADLKRRLISVESDVKYVKDISDLGTNVADEVQKEVKEMQENGVFIPHLEKTAFKLRVRGKGGKGAKPLSKEEILDVQKIARSARDCARKLGVSYVTYRKYAKLHGVHTFFDDKPVKGQKLKYLKSPYKGKYPIDDILAGKWPNFPIHRLKDKLIRSKKKEAECEQCGFKERRLSDGKIPLLVSFNDDNPKNFDISNLKVMCYNCTFLIGKGYIKKGKKHFDPDILQDSKKILDARF